MLALRRRASAVSDGASPSGRGRRCRRSSSGPVALRCGDVGAHHARAQHRHAHIGVAVALHLEVQRLHDGHHAVLGGVVGAEARHRHEPGHRGSAHDVGFLGLDEMGQEVMHAVDHTPQAHVHHPLPVDELLVADEPSPADAGVVAHHVHGAEAVDGGRRQSAHRVGVGDIGDDAECFDSPLGDFGFRSTQRGFLDVGEHHVGALAGEAQRQRFADPRCCPGHYRDASGHGLHVCPPVPRLARSRPAQALSCSKRSMTSRYSLIISSTTRVAEIDSLSCPTTWPTK